MPQSQQSIVFEMPRSAAKVSEPLGQVSGRGIALPGREVYETARLGGS
jgi:hypothetical protein